MAVRGLASSSVQDDITIQIGEDTSQRQASDGVGAEREGRETGHNNDSIAGLISADIVDEQQLEKDFKDRMKANMVDATEVLPHEESRRNPFLIIIFLVAVLAIVLGLTFGLRENTPATAPLESSNLPTMSPTPSPTLTEVGFLRELLQPISGTALDDATSPQGQALNWLAFEDQANLDFRATNTFVLIERYVMAVLYYSTGGPEWYDDLRFLSNYSVCEWPNIGEIEDELATSNEVDCDETGHIVKLRIEENNLNGTMPSELSALSSLEILSLTSGDLQGTLPSELGDLSSLNFFQMAMVNLHGTIPESFGKLTTMETFSVYNNELSGELPAQFFRSGFNLEIIDFGRNRFEGTIPEFVTQSGLVRIYLEDNMFNGTIPSSTFAQLDLELLSISNNILTGTIGQGIGILDSMWFFDGGGNYFTSSLPTTLGSLQDLQYLFLGGNALSGTIPSEIGQLDELIHLDMSFNKLTGQIPSELSQLDDLSFFDATSNQLNGTVPGEFAEFTSLTRFYFSDNNITGDLDASFCNRSILTTEIEADCGGVTPEVDCPCCTSCCDDGDDCELSVLAICEVKAGFFELEPGRGASCECSPDGTKLTCSDTTCESCNLDETLCAVNKDYGYALNDTTGDILYFENTLEYVAGYVDTTITLLDDTGCKVWVNGEQCRGCGHITCRSGFEGYRVYCDNLDGGFNFNSCDEFVVAGYLEIFQLYDESLLSGCAPLFEQVS